MILTLLRLFWEFFKTGLFSVGGGLATLPFIYDISDKTGWFTHGQIADMIAVAESTPGPIGINMATYVGFTTAGVLGSVVATLGIITPPITIILIIAKFLQRFRESTLVEQAFYGLRPASAALIAAAGVSVVKIALLDLAAFAQSHGLSDLFQWKAIALAVFIWLLTNVVKQTKKLHPLGFIALSAVVGIVLHFGGV
jgi:chromate transporter